MEKQENRIIIPDAIVAMIGQQAIQIKMLELQLAKFQQAQSAQKPKETAG